MKYSGKSAQLGAGSLPIGEPQWVPLLEGSRIVGRARSRDDGGVDWESNDESVGSRLFRGEWGRFSLGGVPVDSPADGPRLDPAAPDGPNVGKAAKGKAD